MASKISLTVHWCQRTYGFAPKSFQFDTAHSSLTDLIKICSKYFDVKGEALYHESGEEILSLKSLSNDDHIFVSNGEKIHTQNELFHFCVFGAGGIGKSGLALRFIQGQYIPDYPYDIEHAYRKCITVDGNSVVVDILDTCDNNQCSYGEHVVDSLCAPYMRDKDGFILVFAINDRKSYTYLESCYSEIRELFDEDLDDIPSFILVGNKVDLDDSNIRCEDDVHNIVTNWYRNTKNDYNVLLSIPREIVNIIYMHCMITQRQVSQEEAQQRADEWGAIKYIETSGKSDQNVSNMFGCLVREMIAKIEHEMAKHAKYRTEEAICIALE